MKPKETHCRYWLLYSIWFLLQWVSWIESASAPSGSCAEFTSTTVPFASVNYTVEVGPVFDFTPVGFDDLAVVFVGSSLNLSCRFNATYAKTACGFLRGYFASVGPFIKLTVDLEWPAAQLPQRYPGLTILKLLLPDYWTDTVTVRIQPVTSTTTSFLLVTTGGGDWERNSSMNTINSIGAGRHNLEYIWDNQSAILFSDGAIVQRIDRNLTGDKYWPNLGGDTLLFFLDYDANSGVADANDPTITGTETNYLIHSMNLQCISPYASNCFKSNPLPGVATCDLKTATWVASGEIVLNNSASGNVLNISSTSVSINGSIALGGGVVADRNTQLNVTGVIIFSGTLTVNVSTIENLNGSSIVIITYSNHSGEFDAVELVGTPPLAQSCQKYVGTPKYEDTKFSLIFSIKNECERKGTRHVVFIATVVVLAVLLFSIAVIVITVCFCKDSVVFQRKLRTRKDLMSANVLN